MEERKDRIEEMQVTIGAGVAGERLDRALAAAVPALSRSRLQALIRAGQVAVGGRTIVEPRHPVNSGDPVALRVPPPEPAAPVAQAIPIDVLYEDDSLIVVNKPAGMVVHPGAGSRDGTLVNALLHHCRDSLSGIGGVERPGIVHRLDKDTSGVIVVAKTDAAHRDLSAQFADHGRSGVMERRYLALVWGVPERRGGRIDAPLGRSPTNHEKMTVRRDGREAVTHYRVVTALQGSQDVTVAALVACRLETGRTHQIRVHMAHIGHPVVGDDVYGGGFKTKRSLLGPAAQAALDAMGRQALHAQILRFRHPASGETMTFESPLPPEIEEFLNAGRGNMAADTPFF